MINTLELRHIKYKLNNIMKKIQINIDGESALMTMRRLYETAYINTKKGKGQEIMSEKIYFLTDAKESFLIFTLSILEENNGREQWKKVSVYIFLEDLIKKGSRIVLNFDMGKVKIYYTLHTPYKAEIKHYEKCDPKIRPEEIPDFIAQAKLLQEFIKKITPLRRINTDVTDFIEEKNIKRDIYIVLGLLLFVIFPIVSLVGCLIFISLFKARFKVRAIIVKKFMRYFEDYEDYFTEMKKNMHFIKLQQNMLINLSDVLRKLFYDKNRYQLFIIFRYIGLVLIGLIFTLLLKPSIQLSLTGAIICAFAVKYNQELINYLKSKSWFGTSKTALKVLETKANRFKHLVSVTKPVKLYKTCFTYENQRWYVGKGFVGKTFYMGKLIREI